MRYPLWISLLALAAAVAVTGCKGDQPAAGGAGAAGSGVTFSRLTVPSGTSLDVTLANGLSSESANVGDSWNGTIVNGRDGIPAGSSASGTVSAVKAAVKGSRAMLDLRLTSISVDGHNYRVNGGTEAIVAGSTRARNLGAIAASTAGGALIGKAVSGSGKGTLIGAVVGGGVATGVVATSDGYQVVLKPGTALSFTTSEAVAVRR